MSRLQYVAIVLFIISTRSALGASETKVDEKNPIINGSTVSVPIIEVNSETPATPSNTTNATTSSPSSTQEPKTSSKPITPEAPTKPTPVSPTTSVKPTQNTSTTSTPVSPTTSVKPTQNTSTTSTEISTSVKTTRATLTTTVRPPRSFDGPSFIGGIVLALGLVAIGFVAFKFYKARTELNYYPL